MTTRNPFPGMNPFFEQCWRDAHTRLISYICDAVQEKLPADLVARAEEAVLEITSDADGASYQPDVRVSEPWKLKDSDLTVAGLNQTAEPIRILLEEETERWLEIRDTSGRLITAIELLSPSNKRGAGREDYTRKRRGYINGRVNLVEIDLLRQGEAVFPNAVRHTLERAGACYAICIFRAAELAYEVYPIRLRDRLPAIRIPLRTGDDDLLLELQPLVDQCHERGRYHMLDFRLQPEPRFSEEDGAWVKSQIQEAGLLSS